MSQKKIWIQKILVKNILALKNSSHQIFWNQPFKFGQNCVSNSQIFLIRTNFDQNRVSNSKDIADIEFLLWGGDATVVVVIVAVVLLFLLMSFYVPNDLHLKFHPNRVSNN